MKTISIITTVFNEEDCINEYINKLSELIESQYFDILELLLIMYLNNFELIYQHLAGIDLVQHCIYLF